MTTITLVDRASMQRKPAWIRVKAPTSGTYHETRQLMREKGLHTVCEEAACPNIGECWTQKHATVMILGDTCTGPALPATSRPGMPLAVDPHEPAHLAEVGTTLGLAHVTMRVMSVAQRSMALELYLRWPRGGCGALEPDGTTARDWQLD